MAEPTSNTSGLAQLVQSLPQELYDSIYDFTFTTTFKPHDQIHVSKAKGYRVPSILQVDCASRSQAAASYYGTRAFYFNRRDELIAWVRSLPVEHQHLIREIRYDSLLFGYLSVADIGFTVSTLFNDMRRLGLHDMKGVFRVQHLALDPLEWVTVREMHSG